MATLREIRRRIRSVKNIRQITKALQAVSASRVRRAQDAATATRPYTAKARDLLASVASLGDTAARSVVQAREERPFSSIQDLRDRTRLTRSHIDTLRDTGALAGLPDTDQLSLF